ncbi:putative 3-hydroxyisobutyryl-CoA hydrolase 3 [Zea mays]|uniref:3-hydroxyisobutyryl-CoA hydrolase n=1 Tax=Zea mays TaxID=4577 RepID=A0A3L6FX50_MAIZE|nr:putative 3-hydroxyisobutyryl-CoA hydrolase 3 [Zea mays]
MIKGLLRCFTAYVKDDGVKRLIMKGNGSAFCAGGDIVAGVQSIYNESWKRGADMFRDIYSLIYIIATYIKPQVSLLTGIVMGGGAGVSLHGRFRVVTENTVFAMPETALGHFPDVGASYFLSRLPGFYGEYVALAGARLDGAEMLACGLATHFVPSNVVSLFFHSLEHFRLEIINNCFSKRTVEEIISSLIRQWRTQTVGECLQREYIMVCHVIRGEFSQDFFEGCRAILVDKDKMQRFK